MWRASGLARLHRLRRSRRLRQCGQASRRDRRERVSRLPVPARSGGSATASALVVWSRGRLSGQFIEEDHPDLPDLPQRLVVGQQDAAVLHGAGSLEHVRQRQTVLRP